MYVCVCGGAKVKHAMALAGYNVRQDDDGDDGDDNDNDEKTQHNEQRTPAPAKIYNKSSNYNNDDAVDDDDSSKCEGNDAACNSVP